MEELLARFLQYMDSLNSGSVHTRAAYQRDIREFISFLQEEGIEELQDADRIIVMNYIASLREKPGVSGEMKNSTIARKLSSLRSFYRYLNEYVGITQNPFLYFKTPKRAKRIPEFLFYDEMDTFLSSFDLDTPDGLRDRAMFELMYACGLPYTVRETSSALFPFMRCLFPFGYTISICTIASSPYTVRETSSALFPFMRWQESCWSTIFRRCVHNG